MSPDIIIVPSDIFHGTELAGRGPSGQKLVAFFAVPVSEPAYGSILAVALEEKHFIGFCVAYIEPVLGARKGFFVAEIVTVVIGKSYKTVDTETVIAVRSHSKSPPKLYGRPQNGDLHRIYPKKAEINSIFPADNRKICYTYYIRKLIIFQCFLHKFANIAYNDKYKFVNICTKYNDYINRIRFRMTDFRNKK